MPGYQKHREQNEKVSNKLRQSLCQNGNNKRLPYSIKSLHMKRKTLKPNLKNGQRNR